MKKIPKRIHFPTPMLNNSIPKDIIDNVKELFVCIWPQQINITHRANLKIVYDSTCNAKGLQVEFSIPPKKTQTLLFDKKADFLMIADEPLLNVKKGGFFKCHSCEEEKNLFTGDYKRQQKFKEMLSKLKPSDGAKEKLESYLIKNFNDIICYKQSYSFAVYMQVDFVVENQCYLINRQTLSSPTLPIYGFLAFVAAEQKNNKGHKVWDSQWISDIGEKDHIEIVEEYNEETFDKMLKTTIDQFLVPMLKNQTSVVYIQKILQNENLPGDKEACNKILDKLLSVVLDMKGWQSEC